MAAEKVTVWTLEFDASEVEYLRKLDVGGATTLEALRLALESNDVLEWAFEFWDVEDRRGVRKKLERLNGFSKEVHVIRVVLEADGLDNKRQRVHGSFSAEPAVPMEEGIEFVQVEEEEDPAAAAVGSSRVSGTTTSEEVDKNPLQSTLLPTAVTNRYLERAKKLRPELQRLALDDHDW